MYYSPIVQGCTNTQKGRAKFNNFLILLDSGCSSTIVTRILIEKINPKKICCDKKAYTGVNITTNINVKIFSTLNNISAMKIVTWNFHVDDSSKGRYDMILVRNLLT